MSSSSSKKCSNNKQYKLPEALSALKQRIRDSDDKSLKSLVDDDNFLTTFLVGRKYNVQRAFDTAKGYVTAKNGKYKDLFAMTPETVRHVLEGGLFGALKHRDQHGRLIGFLRIPNLDIKTMEFDEIMRTAILFAEYFWYDFAALEKGQVFIIDYSGYNFSIFTRYSFNQKLNFVMLFLNNYPSKFKSAHIFNNPRIVGYTYSLIKPFLPEKLKKRIFLHAYNQENLLNHFSPDILPKWMGGNLTDEEAIDYDMVERILRGHSHQYSCDNVNEAVAAIEG